MSTPLRLLLVEDSAGDAALLVRLLRQGQFEVVSERVETSEAMESALDRQGWDLIIADHSLPSFGAEAALALVRRRDLDLPLIIVSGTISDEAAIEGMKQGAADYLLKDRLGRLGEAVQRALASKRLRAEKMEADEALRQSEARFRTAFEGAAIGMTLVAPSGRILQVNPAFRALLGYSKEELLARDFQSLTHPDDLAISLAHTRRLLDGAEAGILEKRYLHRDGHTIWVHLSATVQRDAAGQPVNFINQVQDVTGRRQAEQALRHQASHDSLTDLPNRVLLHERLDAFLGTAEGMKQPFSLLLLDLDRFKDVNDTLGHRIGDDLLRQVAARLQEALGASETVARLGGDEFAIVLPAADAAAATTVARLVLDTLERPFQVEQHLLSLGGSMGIAVYPEHGADPQILLQHSDVAMYVAKQSPTGIAVYDPAHDQHTIRRLALMHDLRMALREGGLRLFYQPKVVLPSGQVCGVEALLRWSHPVHGPIPPAEFIPLAEQTGMVVPLTEWVLVTALDQARRWRDAGQPIPIAVNLSAPSLQDQRFPDLVARHLQHYEMMPADLTLEITESSLMADPVRAREVLTRLHELGVRMAIDDFGTGYSSLAYLKHLPVDEVKIDKSFVLGMGAGDQQDAAIVQSVVAMAHALGKLVVAEGVEDAATYLLLGRLDCDALQGYHLSRPLPPPELEHWLREYRPSPIAAGAPAALLPIFGLTE